MNRFVYWALGGLILMIVVAVIAATLLVRSTRSTVNELHREIVESGDRLEFSEYANDQIPADSNAFQQLMDAQAEMDAFVNAYFEIANLEMLDGSPQDGQPLQSKLATLEKLLADHPNLFENLERASLTKDFWSDIDYSRGLAAEMPQSPLARAVARSLSAKAVILATRGDGDGALKACVTGLRIQMLLQNDPVIVTYLSCLAGETQLLAAAHYALMNANPSDTAKDELANVLADLDSRAGLIRAFKGERSLGILTFKQIRNGDIESNDELPATGLSGTGFGDAYLYDDEATYIRLMNTQIKLVRQPKSERDHVLQSMEEELNASSFRNVVTKLIFPAMMRVIDATDDIETRIRCLRVLLTADDLQEGDFDQLPDQIGIDPFTGSPLQLNKREDTWVIYGVGRNLEDDGGQLDQGAADIGYVVPDGKVPN